MDVSPITPNMYNTPTSVGGVGVPAVSKPEIIVPAVSAPSVADTPESGVVLQFSGGSEPKSGRYTTEGIPVEDSKRIKMEKARMKKEGEPCQACSERKYQDGSNDAGVSFKAATNIAPEAAASLVRAHEQQHVSHERANAHEKGLTAMSTVKIHTDICPECKKIYVSGGTTTTQFKADPSKVIDAYAKRLGKTASMLLGENK